MITPMTPAMLILLLRPYGYEVTERCLTDWRWKGYLPSLAKQSRGFRRGVLRYWIEKDILQQALDICRRLKGPGRKRTYGAVHKNWLAGANIATTRARESWVNEIRRSARYSKEYTQRCATQFSRETALKSGMIRDALEEFQNIWARPNYPVGSAQDVSFIRTVAQRVLRPAPDQKNVIVIEEEKLFAFLSALNATFSPAGFRNTISHATNRELLHARNSYLHWWQKLSIPWLMPLAQALAPVIVPLLLPTKTVEGHVLCVDGV